MLKYFKWSILQILFLVILNGCSSDQHQKRQTQFQGWIKDNGKIKVLSTTAIVDDLVKQVGGDYVDTIVLIQGELDPHSYQLVKGDDEKLAFAQLIFFSGLGLEHGPSLHAYLSNNPKAIGLGDMIDREQTGRVIFVQGQKDPHIWMDIALWSKAIPFIVKTLSQQDPLHATAFQENGKRLQAEMEKMDRVVKEIMHQIPENQRYLVTSHDAFNYFARAYLSEENEINSGKWVKRFAAPEGLAPESQLSVIDIQEIIDHLTRYQIHLIFPESNVSRDSIRKIVMAGKEKGLDVQIACCPLYGDAMGEEGSEGDTYLKMILYNAKTLASHIDSGYKKINENLANHEMKKDE